MKTIAEKDVLDVIRATNGRFFSVTFIKRTSGDQRKLVGRLGVSKYVNGRGAPYDFFAKGLIPVYDIQVKGYRTIPIEGVMALRVGGIDYKVIPQGG